MDNIEKFKDLEIVINNLEENITLENLLDTTNIINNYNINIDKLYYKYKDLYNSITYINELENTKINTIEMIKQGFIIKNKLSLLNNILDSTKKNEIIMINKNNKLKDDINNIELINKNLHNKISFLHENLHLISKQNDKLNSKIKEEKNIIKVFENENKILKQNILQLHQKNIDIDKINNDIEFKNENIKDLNNKINKYELDLLFERENNNKFKQSVILKDNLLKEEHDKILKLENEINNSNKKFIDIKNIFEQFQKDNNNKLMSIKDQLAISNKNYDQSLIDIDNLNKKNNDKEIKIKELEDLLNKIPHKEQELNDKLVKIELKLEKSNKNFNQSLIDIDNLNKKNNDKEIKIKELENLLNKIPHKKQQLNDELIKIKIELEQINKNYKQSLIDIDNLNKKNNDKEIKIKELEDLLNKIPNKEQVLNDELIKIKVELEQSNKNYNQSLIDIDNLNKENNDKEIKIKELEEEIESLNQDDIISIVENLEPIIEEQNTPDLVENDDDSIILGKYLFRDELIDNFMNTNISIINSNNLSDPQLNDILKIESELLESSIFKYGYLKLQWTRNDVDIIGENTTTYTINTIDIEKNIGFYMYYNNSIKGKIINKSNDIIKVQSLKAEINIDSGSIKNNKLTINITNIGDINTTIDKNGLGCFFNIYPVSRIAPQEISEKAFSINYNGIIYYGNHEIGQNVFHVSNGIFSNHNGIKPYGKDGIFQGKNSRNEFYVAHVWGNGTGFSTYNSDGTNPLHIINQLFVKEKLKLIIELDDNHFSDMEYMFYMDDPYSRNTWEKPNNNIGNTIEYNETSNNVFVFNGNINR